MKLTTKQLKEMIQEIVLKEETSLAEDLQWDEDYYFKTDFTFRVKKGYKLDINSVATFANELKRILTDGSSLPNIEANSPSGASVNVKLNKPRSSIQKQYNSVHPFKIFKETQSLKENVDESDPMDKLAHNAASAVWEKIKVNDPEGNLYYSVKDKIKDVLKQSLK